MCAASPAETLIFREECAGGSCELGSVCGKDLGVPVISLVVSQSFIDNARIRIVDEEENGVICGNGNRIRAVILDLNENEVCVEVDTGLKRCGDVSLFVILCIPDRNVNLDLISALEEDAAAARADKGAFTVAFKTVVLVQVAVRMKLVAEVEYETAEVCVIAAVLELERAGVSRAGFNDHIVVESIERDLCYDVTVNVGDRRRVGTCAVRIRVKAEVRKRITFVEVFEIDEGFIELVFNVREGFFFILLGGLFGFYKLRTVNGIERFIVFSDIFFALESAEPCDREFAFSGVNGGESDSGPFAFSCVELLCEIKDTGVPVKVCRPGDV